MIEEKSIYYRKNSEETIDIKHSDNTLKVRRTINRIPGEWVSLSLKSIEAEELLKHIKYNPLTDKIEADRAIETTLNSLFLGEQHKMSSGAENIYFTNLTSDINFYPMWAGLKNQSIEANRDSSGLIAPSGRVFGDYGVLTLGGNPVSGTAIAYDGDNYFPFNISGVGISTVVAEDISADIRLKYELSVNGTPVYTQYLEHDGLSVEDTLEWFFDHPLDVLAGSTNHASITKIDSEENSLGLFLVCEGDDGTGRYQTTVGNRGFEDKNIAFSDDLQSLDIIGYYDIYVDPTFTGDSEDGSNLRPYSNLETAIAASNANDKVFIKGVNTISSEITLTHSLHFYGIDGTSIKYVSYNEANGDLLEFGASDNVQDFTFKNI